MFTDCGQCPAPPLLKIIILHNIILLLLLFQTVDSVVLLLVPAAQVAGLPSSHQAAQPQGDHHLPLEAPYTENWTELPRYKWLETH